jgi:hypothetical protein
MFSGRILGQAFCKAGAPVAALPAHPQIPDGGGSTSFYLKHAHVIPLQSLFEIADALITLLPWLTLMKSQSNLIL